jgi:tripartite-type tricarboxylate transporter receptor subunit TctC
LILGACPLAPRGAVSELIALAKAKPGTLNFGSPGNGTPPHLASELLKRMAGIEATHIPYKGGGALTAAMLSGQLTWSMDGPTAQLPHVRNGSLRALAVTGARRLAALPDVPTVAEAGLPGYEYGGWTGIAAPAATPRAVVERLHAEIARIAATEEAQRWFEAAGAEPGILTPAQFTAFIRAEYEKWGKVVREARLRAE